MTRARKAPGSREPKARTSGPTQPENARKRGQLLLRLDPATEATLRRLAALRGMSLSDVVSGMIGCADAREVWD
jgi:predicted HicB family RNase H-like nuclease